MKKNFVFRLWLYFRAGWTIYLALFFAAINTATVTYYLSVEKIPQLEFIFPSFSHYIVILALIIIPFLVMIGWFHYRKTSAYGTENEVLTENAPYMYKLPPGWHTEALFPTLLKMTEFMIKSSNNEKFDDKNIQELTELHKKLDLLLSGESLEKK